MKKLSERMRAIAKAWRELSIHVFNKISAATWDEMAAEVALLEDVVEEFNDFLQVIREHTFEWITLDSNANMVTLTYSQKFKEKFMAAITKAKDTLAKLEKQL